MVSEASDLLVFVLLAAYLPLLILLWFSIQPVNPGQLVAVIRGDGITRYLPRGFNLASPFLKVVRVSLFKPLPESPGEGVVVAAADPEVGFGIARFGGRLCAIDATRAIPVGARIQVEPRPISARAVFVRRV